MPTAAGLRSLTLVLTAACNLRCTYCYQDRGGGRVMDEDTLRRAVDLLLGSSEEQVTLELYGGEPLLAFGLLRRAVEYAQAAAHAGKRLRLGLSTNGTMLDDERVSFLEEHRVTTRVSFDGVAAAQDLRAPGTFALLDDRLRRIQRGAPRFFREQLEIAVTLAPEALGSFSESVDYFLGHGVRTLTVSPVVGPRSHFGPEAAGLLDEQFQRVFRSSRRYLDRTGRVPLVFFRKTKGGGDGLWRTGPVCAAGAGTSLAVDVDGRVGVCGVLAESCRTLPTSLAGSEAFLRLGRLSDRSFPRRLREHRALLRASRIFEHREDRYSSRGSCRECAQRRACFVCPIAYTDDPLGTDPRRVPDFMCTFNRIALELRDRFPDPPYAPALLQGLGPPPAVLQRL